MIAIRPVIPGTRTPREPLERPENSAESAAVCDLDTHPSASARIERLELVNLGEHLYTSPIIRYGKEFIDGVFDYASGLNEERLLASIAADEP